MTTFFAKKKLKYISILILCVLLVFSLPFSSSINSFLVNSIENKELILRKNNQLFVHFISVDNADAIAINFPNGETALIDTGSPNSQFKVIKYLKDNVLNNTNNKTINHMFLSHADSDHIGGAVAILNSFEVKNIYRSRQYIIEENIADSFGEIIETEEYIKLIHKVYEEVKDGTNFFVVYDMLQIKIGEVTMQIFSPLVKYDNSNDYSYFIKLSYKNKSALFCGDATINVENDILTSHQTELDCDILKVAHHGSDTGCSESLLDAVSPQYAVISVGNNSYGHPSDIIINRLHTSGCDNIYRTDNKGNILFRIGDNISYYFNNYTFTSLNLKWNNFVSCLLVVISAFMTYDISKTIVKVKLQKETSKSLS